MGRIFRLRFTAIELLVVVGVSALSTVMMTASTNRMSRGRAAALKVSCSNNLRGVGTKVFQFESPAYYDKTTFGVPAEKGKEGGNSTTLSPIVALYKVGLLVNNKSVYCPMDKSGFDLAQLSNKDVGLLTQKETPADKLVISKGNKVASNYLFTLFYDKKSKSSRVIAADAADAAGGFSPNHGDRAGNLGNGANALFKDNHVRMSNPDYTVDGSIDRGNLWNDKDAPTAKDLKKTQIGHY